MIRAQGDRLVGRLMRVRRKRRAGDYDVGKSGSANAGQTEERGWHIFDQVVITENGINISTLAWIILVEQ